MTSITFFLILVPVLAAILLAVNLLLAPHSPYQEKDSAFECGFHSFLGQNRTQFSISFFIFGLLFLLFDLEILLVLPSAMSLYLIEGYGIVVMLIFFLLLTAGFAFELGKNALKIDSRQNTKSQAFIPLPTLESNIFSFALFKRLFNRDTLFICVISFTVSLTVRSLFVYYIGIDPCSIVYLDIWWCLVYSIITAPVLHLTFIYFKNKKLSLCASLFTIAITVMSAILIKYALHCIIVYLGPIDVVLLKDLMLVFPLLLLIASENAFLGTNGDSIITIINSISDTRKGSSIFMSAPNPNPHNRPWESPLLGADGSSNGSANGSNSPIALDRDLPRGFTNRDFMDARRCTANVIAAEGRNVPLSDITNVRQRRLLKRFGQLLQFHYETESRDWWRLHMRNPQTMGSIRTGDEKLWLLSQRVRDYVNTRRR